MLLPLLRLLRRLRRPVSPCPAALPERLRAYAIGDVHGRADLLERLFAAIAGDLVQHSAVGEARVVMLGDMIDRGPDSRRVIELVREPPLPSEITVTALMGNHERMLLDTLDDGLAAVTWLGNGGDATVASYGVAPVVGTPTRERIERMRAEFANALPATHRRWLEALPASLRLGGYLLVHAGVRPGVPLDAQRPLDLMWIRASFLDSTADHGAVVVHGHHISPQPELRANRIGIDTGAYCGGPLTAVVLEGRGCAVLQAAPEGIRRSVLRPQ